MGEGEGEGGWERCLRPQILLARKAVRLLITGFFKGVHAKLQFFLPFFEKWVKNCEKFSKVGAM